MFPVARYCAVSSRSVKTATIPVISAVSVTTIARAAARTCRAGSGASRRSRGAEVGTRRKHFCKI